MKTFKDIIDEHGLSCLEISRLGVPYQTVYKHYKGDRPVSANYAVRYEQLLKIPRHEFCPHLWKPANA